MQISYAIRTLEKAGFTVASDVHPNGSTYRATKPGALAIEFSGDCFGGANVSGGFGLKQVGVHYEPDARVSFAPSLAKAIKWAQ